MAFVVEDGTGKEDANAYVDVAYVDGYFADRGNTAWTGTEEAKQQAIVKATDYIETVYSQRFLGSKKTDTQALSFPRDDATSLPVALQKATAEYALRALSAPLLPDPVYDEETGGILIGKREKIGPLEDEWTYKADGEVLTIRPYPAADLLLRSLIRDSSRCIRN